MTIGFGLVLILGGICQDDVAHVLSEHRIYVKYSNRIRPYNVTVDCLTALETETAEQGQDGSMFELAMTVVLPRGVEEESVQTVVRQEVRSADSTWRRSAPPFYSLDAGYIREEPKPKAPEQEQPQAVRETESPSPRGATAADVGGAATPVPAQATHSPEAEYGSPVLSADGASSAGESDDDDDDDEDDEEEDSEDDSEEIETEDPATAEFAAAIAEGSSPDQACVRGLTVICGMLRDGGVPEPALSSLQEKASVAFRKARIKGAEPLHAWRQVGELAETGLLF